MQAGSIIKIYIQVSIVKSRVRFKHKNIESNSEYAVWSVKREACSVTYEVVWSVKVKVECV